MKIDLSMLTDEELIELQRDLKKERGNRKSASKDSLRRTAQVYGALTGHSTEDPDYWSPAMMGATHDIHDSLIAICDFVYGNYIISKTQKGHEQLRRKGPYIEKNYQDYKNFYDKLTDLILEEIARNRKGEI